MVLCGLPAVICGVFSAACCACNAVRCCCTGAMGAGGVGKTMAKLLYVMFLGIATVTAYVIGSYGEANLVDEDVGLFSVTVTCETFGLNNKVCSGDSAIFRASSACVFFFALMLVGTIPRPTFSGDKNWTPLLGEGFHRGFWGFKTLAFFALLIGSFFFPTSFFNDETYRDVARVVSTFFLAVQVLVLIDFAYAWNDAWVERAFSDGDEEPNSKGWIYALLICSFILYAAGLAGLIALFIYYGECSSGIGFLVVTLVGFILYTGLSFGSVYIVNFFLLITCYDMYDPEDGQPNSVAPASVVSVYCTYLVWSALRSNPDTSPQCNPFDDFLQEDGWEVFIGIAFATVSITWTAFAAANNGENLLKGDRGADDVETGPSGAYQTGENADGTARYARDENGGGDDDDEDPEPKLWFFHLLMLSASFYMAMVLTNWGVSSVESANIAQGATSGDVGLISMWVKIAAQWASIILFIWTLVAPYILSEREF